MPFVTDRWLGGMLTNFSTVRKSINRMEEIAQMETDGTFDQLTKKERLMLNRERDKLERVLGGISNMSRLPGAIFICDTVKESIAMNEAIKLNIPIIAMVDTNCDPDVPDFIIPCNDDSARTVKLIVSNVADAIIEGNAAREAHTEEQVAQDLADDGGKKKSGDDSKEKSSPRRRRRRKKDTSADEEE
jgi:small subunit ribosomal protein S2